MPNHILKVVKIVIEIGPSWSYTKDNVYGTTDVFSERSITSCVPGMGAFDAKAGVLSIVIGKTDLDRNRTHIFLSSSPQKRL